MSSDAEHPDEPDKPILPATGECGANTAHHIGLHLLHSIENRTSHFDFYNFVELFFS
jgi:hypothetical protein